MDLTLTSLVEKGSGCDATQDLRGRMQEAVYEGVLFLWVLGDYNPRMLKALTTCNVEAPGAASSSSSGNALDWPAILVSTALQKNGCTRVIIAIAVDFVGEFLLQLSHCCLSVPIYLSVWRFPFSNVIQTCGRAKVP